MVVRRLLSGFLQVFVLRQSCRVSQWDGSGSWYAMSALEDNSGHPCWAFDIAFDAGSGALVDP